MINCKMKISNKKAILLIAICIFSLFLPLKMEVNDVKASNPAWWNENWNYRRKISLFHLDELVDFQILLELPVADYVGETLNNGADIRFVMDDHATVLNHWIEKWDTTGVTNKVWVKVDIDISYLMGYIAEFYMYYGNFAASSTSNGFTVFPFFDDFSGSQLNSQWDIIERTDTSSCGHTMDISNGELHVYTESTDGYSGYVFLSNNWFNIEDFAVHVEGRITNYDNYRGNGHVNDVLLQDSDSQLTGISNLLYGDYRSGYYIFLDGGGAAYDMTDGVGTLTYDYEVNDRTCWSMQMQTSWAGTISSSNTLSGFNPVFQILLYALVSGSSSHVHIDTYYNLIYLRSYSTVDPDIEIFEKQIGGQQIFISSITLPNNVNKGMKVPVDIEFTNPSILTYELTSISWEIESVQAGSDTYGWVNSSYGNDNDPTILEGYDDSDDITLFIPPSGCPTKTVYIDFKGYPNGAMNIGKWKINNIAATFSNGLTVQGIPSINHFFVKPKAEQDGPHPVFIYYLWNAYGTGNNWAGDNPRQYFEDGFGTVEAGLKVFNSPIVPIPLDMIICYDDNSWDIPVDKSEESMIDFGRSYVGSQLNMPHWWKSAGITDCRNCGFDILIMGAARVQSRMGYSEGSCYVFFMAGDSTHAYQWKYNIDGCVQHQISLMFGADDFGTHESNTECVNNFSPIDHLHEYNIFWWFYFIPNPNATNLLCYTCYNYMNTGWYRCYKITESDSA